MVNLSLTYNMFFIWIFVSFIWLFHSLILLMFIISIVVIQFAFVIAVRTFVTKSTTCSALEEPSHWQSTMLWLDIPQCLQCLPFEELPPDRDTKYVWPFESEVSALRRMQHWYSSLIIPINCWELTNCLWSVYSVIGSSVVMLMYGSVKLSHDAGKESLIQWRIDAFPIYFELIKMFDDVGIFISFQKL